MKFNLKGLYFVAKDTVPLFLSVLHGTGISRTKWNILDNSMQFEKNCLLITFILVGKRDIWRAWIFVFCGREGNAL